MDNYDRIVAFMNGKDPSEVQTTKARNTMTNALSIIWVNWYTQPHNFP